MKRKIISAFKIVSLFTLVIFITGMLIPQRFSLPVEGARQADYNQASFWYYPWGESGTHKGVDIFAPKGTRLKSSVSGLVVYTGQKRNGGNVVLILGPKWRFHYYAHLDKITTTRGWINRNESIGTVGNSGNAQGKPAHLHYSIYSLAPYFLKADSGPQGWKKMFFVNPIPLLNSSFQ